MGRIGGDGKGIGADGQEWAYMGVYGSVPVYRPCWELGPKLAQFPSLPNAQPNPYPNPTTKIDRAHLLQLHAHSTCNYVTLEEPGLGNVD